MKLDKLRKKTVKKYLSENTNSNKTKDEIKQKFDKKIARIDKLRIVGEEVYLDTDNLNDTNLIIDNDVSNSKRLLYQLDDPALTIIFRYLPLQDKKNCRLVCSQMNTKIMLLDNNLLWKVDMITYMNSLQAQKNVVINSKMKINLILPEQIPRLSHEKKKLKKELKKLIESVGNRIVALIANGAVLDKLSHLLTMQKLNKLFFFQYLELAHHKCTNLKSVLELNSKSVQVLKIENIDLTDTEVVSRPLCNMTSIEISHCNGNAQLAAIFNMSRQSLNRVEIIHIVDTTLFQDLNFEMESLRFLRIASVNNIELTELLQSCSNLRELELSAAGISTKLANNMMSSLTYMKIELIEKTTLPINLINSAGTTLEYLKLGNVKLCPYQDIFIKLAALKTLHLVCCSPEIMAALIKVCPNVEEVWFECVAMQLPLQDWNMLPKLKSINLRCNYDKSALKKSLPKHINLYDIV